MLDKLIKIVLKKLTIRYQYYRKYFYSILSENKYYGNPIINQPTLFLGKGEIIFGNKNILGYFPSPFFYDGYNHIEARTKESKIVFGNNIHINNNFVAISEVSIQIGNDVLIGTNVEIYDSDFHSINRNRIGEKNYFKKEICIKNNVWIGSNVKILKGVTIGENSIISNGSIVTHNIDCNVIAGGIPAKIIKSI